MVEISKKARHSPAISSSSETRNVPAPLPLADDKFAYPLMTPRGIATEDLAALVGLDLVDRATAADKEDARGRVRFRRGRQDCRPIAHVCGTARSDECFFAESQERGR